MFRTKQDVDRHAASVLGRLKNEKEKNSRGYQIARLYFDVSEYEVAKRYLTSFLSVRETVPQAHKLMGHIFLKTNEKEKALACYKRALGLDGSQKDLIIKICELCTQVPMDPERARFWLEKAEQTCPGNDVIFRLREMIAQNSGDEDFQELENLITSELTQRPEDVSLRVKLLRFYLKSGKLDHAYNVAVQTDRTMAFTDSLEWYETLLDVYYAYKGKTGCRGDLRFYTQFLHTLRNVVYLRLCYREPVACAEVLHQFDQVLQEAVQIPNQQEDDWMSFLTEMTGQFFFSCGTLLLKRAQKGGLSWKDVIPLASVCYLLNNSIITIDSRSEWFVSASKDKKSMYEHLHMISNFRRSQGGHTLQALGKGDTATWTQKLRQQYCRQQGREKLYDTVFTLPDMRAKKDSSYLIKNRTYTDNVLLFPSRRQMRSFDSGCYRLHPQSLTNFIWLALQRYSCKDKAQPYYGFDIFEDLVYSVKNMSVGGAESLCQLDTDVFLIASVCCAALRHQEMIHMGHSDPTQPDFLPLSLTKPLCTQEQADWWLAAYKFHTNTVKDNFSKMRHTLQRGIETVRLVAGHGVSVNLIIHIARSLEVKASEMKQLGPQFTLNVTDTETRAEFYWEQALEMLNRLDKNRNPHVPKHRLFKDDTDQDLDEATIKALTSEVQYAVGCAAMKKNKYEDAINIFDKLHTPYASLNSAKIYKVLAEQERSRDAPVGREQHQILLTKARDAIYRTFDLLQGDKKHELNKSVQQHYDEIESQLMSVAEWGDDEEPSQYHTPTAIQMDGDVSSPDHSTPRDKSKTKSPAAQVSFNTSDAGRHIRPSPEHMDAKIRSLAYSQESLVKMVLARNEELVKFNSQLVEALRENREVITQLKELNKSVQQHYDEIESQLMSVAEWGDDEEPSQYHTPTAIQMDGDVSSPDHSTPRDKSRTKSPAAQVSFNTSDAGRHIRPSPEHMDAKIRSLAYSQESLVKMVLARNEELVKFNSQLVEALRENREVITQLKELNKSVQQHYDEIESQLMSVAEWDDDEEPSQYHTPTAIQMDGDVSSPDHSTPRDKSRTKSPAAQVSFNTSDAGRHIRPSPEHMDAKIRSLAYSQESLVKMVLARNEELVKFNSQLVEALRENREVITQLKELNKSVQQHYDEIESQLMSVAEWDDDEEPSQYHTPTAIQMDGDVSSPDHSTPRDKSRTKSPAAQVSFNTSDAGRHIRPSPEHMDAKIRSLAYSQESLVKMVLARNEELVKFNSQLVEALRENREVITQLKTEELARQFKKKFEEVQELVRATESASPAKNTNSSANVSKSQDVSVTEEKEEDDDSEEESIMFEKRATLTYFENDEWKKLGMGNLKILYNDDLNGNQIDMETDDKQKVCNHVICREHSIKLENQKRACMWSAQDFSTDEPVRRDFKAAFSSVAAAEEFAKSFMEGVSLARDSELSEKISHEMDTPVIFSHGDATGGQTRILVSQSEASSATSMGGSGQCETRIQPGESEGSQSAASSLTGEGVSATDASSVVSCSPELSALLSSFLEEDQKR
ncbi:ranBP2-like and GRIP domain-containing protein 4 isoform X2 [Haliotis rufescens]|uniref:ranBP2-like and GRIP domain-containing protein 4 isoform X2 n=1 Tax=Haliotis rufescens TaxID=6454 RepID=UPI00201F3025|nr:ranBP2-like and GRIP domain-containing protein 4 isoform X2 [Haliotis rufescens]